MSDQLPSWWSLLVALTLGCGDDGGQGVEGTSTITTGATTSSGNSGGSTTTGAESSTDTATEESTGSSSSESGGVEDPRLQMHTVAIGPNGISDPLEFDVPPNTRSLTVVAEGATDELFALVLLETADGIEHVNLGTDESHAATMQTRYFAQQNSRMPGDLFQNMRLGTFTSVFPYLDTQELPAGSSELRLASTAMGGTVDVALHLPEDDGASTLHLNVLAVTDVFVFMEPPLFVAEMELIMTQAGIDVVVDEVVALEGTAYENITDFSEPQEAPGSSSVELAVLGQDSVMGEGLNLFVNESLPFGVGGLSLGVPGPPEPTSYYYGAIAVHNANTVALARVAAHEVCHFLALPHVQDGSDQDPFDDTSPGQGNLMGGSGIALSLQQSFALTRSALLTD